MLKPCNFSPHVRFEIFTVMIKVIVLLPLKTHSKIPHNVGILPHHYNVKTQKTMT